MPQHVSQAQTGFSTALQVGDTLFEIAESVNSTVAILSLPQLETQIMDCLQICLGDDAPQSNSDAFQRVFPEIQFSENASLSNQAQQGTIGINPNQPVSETNPVDYVVINFPPTSEFYECVDDEDDRDKIESIDNCPEGQKAVQAYENPNTVEGIIRHELGHAFFNLLRVVANERQVLTELSSEAALDVDNIGGEDTNFIRIQQQYFPNAIRSDEELFADAFSVIGRFTSGGDFDGILQPRPTPSYTEQNERDEAQNILDAFFPNSSIIFVELGRMPDTFVPVWIISIDNVEGGDDFIILEGNTLERLYVPTAITDPPSSNYRRESDLPEFQSDKEVLASSRRMQYFQNSFCCWVAQILGYSSGDDHYDCLCSSDE